MFEIQSSLGEPDDLLRTYLIDMIHSISNQNWRHKHTLFFNAEYSPNSPLFSPLLVEPNFPMI